MSFFMDMLSQDDRPEEEAEPIRDRLMRLLLL